MDSPNPLGALRLDLYYFYDVLISRHCVKSVQIHSFFLVRIFPYSGVFSSITGKYKPEITPYLDTYHAVRFNPCQANVPIYSH